MAGVAVFGCTLIDSVDMTGGAGTWHVFHQRERRLSGVVDGGSGPARSGMTVEQLVPTVEL